MNKIQFFNNKRFSVDIKPTYVGYMWLEQYNNQPMPFRRNTQKKSPIASAISDADSSRMSEMHSGMDKENLTPEYFHKLLKLNK